MIKESEKWFSELLVAIHGHRWDGGNGIRYLLLQADQKIACLHRDHEIIFRSAASRSSLKVIQFLLSKEVSDRHGPINVHDNNDEALILAALNGKIEVVKFLMTDPELDRIHGVLRIPEDESEWVFQECCDRQRWDVIRFWMWEKHINITQNLMEELKKSEGLGPDLARAWMDYVEIKKTMVSNEIESEGSASNDKSMKEHGVKRL